VPSFRVDLKREIDLIEEVARLYGADKIRTAPRERRSNAYDAVHDQLAEARRILTGLGLFEAQGQDRYFGGGWQLTGERSLVHVQPVSSDRPVAPEPATRFGRAAPHLAQDLRRRHVRSWSCLSPKSRSTPRERRVLSPAGQRNLLFWKGVTRS